MSEQARLEATVVGRVQGVGFRVWLLRRARKLDLAGWVANTADGHVQAVAEGPRPALESLLEALRVGPPGASVENVSHRFEPALGGLGEPGAFVIRTGAHRGD